MNRYTCLRVALLARSLAGLGTAQSTPDGGQPALAPAPPPPPPAAWRMGPVDVSGMLDAYYSLGFNHPSNHVNLLRNFDDKANQLDLNMGMLTLDRAPNPVGFHADVGFGRVFDIVSATEKDATGMRHFKQAYVDVKPASWKGLELDFGKFVTSAGAEVIETDSNWNYSRSLLFVWAIPYYHFGMRASMPITRQFTGGVQWVGGWNNIVTGATYRTVGLSGAWTTSKFAWSNSYYGGPDENKADRGMRDLYDTTLLLTPNSKANFYINFDYGHASPKMASAFHWAGIAGAARVQVSRKFYLSPRLEWFSDSSGNLTGTAQRVKEFTFTGQYALLSRLLGYLEFRKDWSNQRCFNRGNEPGSWKGQPTVLVGMVALIGPKR